MPDGIPKGITGVGGAQPPAPESGQLPETTDVQQRVSQSLRQGAPPLNILSVQNPDVKSIQEQLAKVEGRGFVVLDNVVLIKHGPSEFERKTVSSKDEKFNLPNYTEYTFKDGTLTRVEEKKAPRMHIALRLGLAVGSTLLTVVPLGIGALLIGAGVYKLSGTDTASRAYENLIKVFKLVVSGPQKELDPFIKELNALSDDELNRKILELNDEELKIVAQNPKWVDSRLKALGTNAIIRLISLFDANTIVKFSPDTLDRILPELSENALLEIGSKLNKGTIVQLDAFSKTKLNQVPELKGKLKPILDKFFATYASKEVAATIRDAEEPAEDTSVMMPGKFHKDVLRQNLKLNGQDEVILKNLKKSQAEVYNDLLKKCREVSPNHGDLLAYRVASFIHQGATKDLLERLTILEGGKIFKAGTLFWDVKVGKNEVIFILETEFFVMDPKRDGVDPTSFKIAVKREVKIPIKTLLTFQGEVPSGLRVRDKFTKIFP